jgi:predicted metal-binding membrane protein
MRKRGNGSRHVTHGRSTDDGAPTSRKSAAKVARFGAGYFLVWAGFSLVATLPLCSIPR